MKLVTFLLFIALSVSTAFSKDNIYSFEKGKVPQGWSIDNGALKVSSDKYKLGKKSLQVTWNSNSTLTMNNPLGIEKASLSKSGGIIAWIYNTKPVHGYLTFSFLDKSGSELCQQTFNLNFTGWRCLWTKFQEDLKLPAKTEIADVKVIFPEGKEGVLYFDYVEFSKNVSWQKMTDAQYTVNRTDFSLIPNFMLYRNTVPAVNNVILSSENDINAISNRLNDWYLGADNMPSNDWVDIRAKEEVKFVESGVKAGNKLKIRYAKDSTPVGYPLFPMRTPDVIDGEKAIQFRTINEKVLIPLALDYKKNGNQKSLEKIKYIYDWFNDQGWADGSGLGSLTFEKLRSAGYFHSFFLVKDKLSPEVLERELNAIHWFSLFGIAYQEPTHAGEVADNLRALAIPKLIYALSIPDEKEREVAMTAFKRYMDNALAIAPGFFGTIKADFSGYHHRGPYHSAYYTHALYAGSLIAYLLHDSPYALSDETMANLKKGLLTFRFFSANLDVPAGTTGRFPHGQQVLESILPAFAYIALSTDEPDQELVAAFKAIVSDKNNQAIIDYLMTVNSNLAYTSTVGEAQLMSKLLDFDIAAEKPVSGSLFMPYSGTLIQKDERFQFNAKGYSRFIWDFESSDSENLKGRYVSNGHLEFFDLKSGRKSFNPLNKDFDWNYISGTTVRVLPDDQLMDKGGSSSGHRHFTDETFLAGVSAGQDAMFSVKLHDITYDKSFRANKSYFFFNDDLILALGSDIKNKDTENITATSIYQSFDGKSSVEAIKNGYLLSDGSLSYVVRGNQLDTVSRGEYARASINHGTAPKSATYEYFILRNGGNVKRAESLLSNKSEIEVLSQNKDAHIVLDKARNIYMGALFNANAKHESLTVQEVNIPLAYILKPQDKGYELFLCEPDMRRVSRAHMGALTEIDVVDQEAPFDTKITLKGLFTATCDTKSLVVSADPVHNITEITISTIRGENYKIDLKEIKY